MKNICINKIKGMIVGLLLLGICLPTTLSLSNREMATKLEIETNLEEKVINVISKIYDVNKFAVTTNVVLVSSNNSGVNSFVRDQEINEFTARYLNAIRLDESQVKQISENRLDRFDADINESKCTECKINEECFKIFGKVDFEGTSVGLFPFSKKAPSKLIGNVTEELKDSDGLTPRLW